ncbi:helix-turn-helix transcriptional regulator [Streptacidiphilus cavernicola]|uniref:Helix-turn-helix transcriptional regulator n=1 Tax=Streptacidiphilus cavernicola TaxID=3342716 RepID=A0ABV6VPG2_9ACTN
MRASRLLSIVLLLQSRGRMTAQELADELEVSVRTVYRDMESLGAAGVPVYGDPGHDGGYALLDGYRTRLTGLHGDEADALSLAGLPGPAAELGLGSVLAVAQLKLDAALPPVLRERSARIRERFHLDAPGWYRAAEPLPHLTAVADAVWNERPLRLRYRRWAEPREVEREVSPLGVVLKGGVWYLVAAAGSGAGAGPVVRTYRVSQILELAPGAPDGGFERPDGFDLAGYWQASLADFDARRFHGEAVLRLSPEALRRMPDLFDSAVLAAVEASAGAPDARGWVRAVIPIESTAHALGEVFRLGWGVEVLAPTELRRLVARTAAEMQRLHADDRPDDGPDDGPDG